MGRRIGIVSVGRSDAGHLSPLFKLLPDAHRYWYATAPVSTPADVARAYGLAVGNFTHQFQYDPCDLIVIFGDRWEQHAAATAAHLMNLPMVHLHAGERTEAVVDDALRDGISAMATWLVTAAEPYATRLRGMGYKRVVNLGTPGLARLPRNPLSWDLQRAPLILVTYHPETLRRSEIAANVNEVMEGVEPWAVKCVWSLPGMDAGRDAILHRVKQFHDGSDDDWLNMLERAQLIVGNSSCGMIEAPSVPLPSVNIGDRQKGRLRASSVIDTPHDRDAIRAAIELALNPEWRTRNLTGENPYGDRHAAERIAEFVTTCAL